MRVLFLVSTAFLIFQSALFATTAPIAVSSKIEKVTIFKQSAQTTRLAQINIPKGKTIFKFTGLPNSLVAKSLQVKGNGNFTILSVQHQSNTVSSSVDSMAIDVLAAANDTLNAQIEEWNLQVQVLKEEEALILNNDKKTNKEKNKLPVDELQIMANFYRQQIGDIRLQVLQYQRKVKAYEKTLNKNKQQIKKLKKIKRTTTKEVLLTILAKQATRGDMQLSYLIPNAGWTPTYDLRVKDVNSPVNLAYKANVYQSSGEDWEEVKLTLSTANPNESGTKPTIQKWNLGFYNPVVYGTYGEDEYGGITYEEVEKELEIRSISSKNRKAKSSPPAPSVPVTTTTYQKATSIEFQIEELYTIKKDGKNYMVNIKEINLPAYYEYYCAPKLDKDVFLTAMISDWEQHNLLSGATSLYFEGTFLGNSALKVESLKDTMVIDLGRDKNIIVERTLEEVFCKTSFLRSKKMEDKAFKIEIRNKKNQPINLVLEDQFPIAVTEDIEVKNGNYEGATLDEKSGIIKWELSINPQATKTTNFNYSVKYPSKKRVYLY